MLKNEAVSTFIEELNDISALKFILLILDIKSADIINPLNS